MAMTGAEVTGLVGLAIVVLILGVVYYSLRSGIMGRMWA